MRALKRLLLALLLFWLALLGVRALYRALASAEKQIRWRLEEMVEGFNDGRARPVLAGVAPDFVDRVQGITRDELHSALAWTFFNEVDERGQLLWSAELDRDALAIEVAEDRRSAQVSCRIQFFRRRAGERQLRWDAHFEGTVARGEDGWQWNAVTAMNYRELRR